MPPLWWGEHREIQLVEAIVECLVAKGDELLAQ